MDQSSSQLSNRYWVRYVVLLIIWLLIFTVAFSGRSRLTSQVESATNIISDDTEAAMAAELLQARFNQTGGDVQHIIILDLQDTTQKITDTQWSNYTLYLSFYILAEMEAEGYDQILSSPIVLQQLEGVPNAEDIASDFISEDESTSMIFLSSTTLSFDDDEQEVKVHVEEIRHLMEDYDGLIDFVREYETDNSIPPGFIVASLPIKSNFEDNLHSVLTGSPANIVDTLEVSNESFERSEITAAIVIIVILFLVFRTPMGVMIPLIATGAALLPAYLLTSFAAEADFLTVNDFLPAVIAMIGIAIAVDYNLFMLVRYREEYRKRRAAFELDDNWNAETRKETQVTSSKKMNATAGTAVMYSGITVLIGFGALLIAGDDFSSAMAIGVALVVLMSIFTARTLTPAILALFGRFLDWPNATSRANQEVEEYKDKEGKSHGFWVNWSKRVMKYPWVFLLIGILFMTPFVILSAQTDLSFSFVKSLPAETESRQGFEILQDEFDLGAINPFSIVIDAGVNDGVFNQDIIDATEALSEDILGYSDTYELDGTSLEFASFTSMSALRNSTDGSMIYLSLAEIQAIFASPNGFVVGFNPDLTPIIQPNWEKLLYIQHVKDYINWDVANNTLVIEISSNLDPGSGAAFHLVGVIQEFITTHFQPLVEADVIEGAWVTGLTALFAESSEHLYQNVPLMLAVAVVLIFLALMILFRSIILPLKAILTIGGSILFGLGTLVFVFQLGNLQLIEVFGLILWQADVSGITYFLPVFLFTTILGLGMDYSIFIISRIKEEYEKSGDMTDSVGLGLSKTAGVVTSAAIIMTATFMVFALSPMLTLKMMGLAMSVAIIVDATIARTILLPAAMKLAGKYNFWLPGWLKKILPEINLEH